MTGAAEPRRVLGPCVGSTFKKVYLLQSFFLSRFQAKPNPATEHCLRTFLEMVGHASSFCTENASNSVSLCLDSVSGAIIIYKGCCIKFFSGSRMKSFPLLKLRKWWVSIGMLLQTMIQGIPLDPLGMPQHTIGEMGLRVFNDAKAAVWERWTVCFVESDA